MPLETNKNLSLLSHLHPCRQHFVLHLACCLLLVPCCLLSIASCTDIHFHSRSYLDELRKSFGMWISKGGTDHEINKACSQEKCFFLCATKIKHLKKKGNDQGEDEDSTKARNNKRRRSWCMCCVLFLYLRIVGGRREKGEGRYRCVCAYIRIIVAE